MKTLGKGFFVAILILVAMITTGCGVGISIQRNTPTPTVTPTPTSTPTPTPVPYAYINDVLEISGVDMELEVVDFGYHDKLSGISGKSFKEATVSPTDGFRILAITLEIENVGSSQEIYALDIHNALINSEKRLFIGGIGGKIIFLCGDGEEWTASDPDTDTMKYQVRSVGNREHIEIEINKGYSAEVILIYMVPEEIEGDSIEVTFPNIDTPIILEGTGP